MEHKFSCPIWGTPAQEIPNSADAITVDSLRAGGKYIISRSANATLAQWSDDERKVLLTDWLIEQRTQGNTCPAIQTTTLNELQTRQLPTVQARADALLNLVRVKCPILGEQFQFEIVEKTSLLDEANEVLAYTSSRTLNEVVYLSNYCEQNGWLRKPSVYGGYRSLVYSFTLMPSGYVRLSELAAKNQHSDRAFVAMWFDVSMNSAFEDGIKPALEQCGYKPIRIDREDHNNKIDDQIIAEIKKARFLVADFTQGVSGARGGVYYEAGFAHGSNIPVIFTCRSNVLKEVHFDTRQYNHIVWETPKELKDALALRIAATIGDGPLKR